MKFFALMFSFMIVIVNAKDPSRQQIDSLINIANNKNAYSNLGDKEMLRLITEAYYLSKDLGYDGGRLESLIKFLEIYYNTNNINGIYEKVDETIRLATELDNNYILSRALRYRAWMYIKIGKYNLAKYELKKAAEIASDIIDNDQKNKSLMNISSTMASYYEAYKSDTDSMLSYANKAYHYASNIKSSNPYKRKYLSATATVIGHILLYKGNVKDAKKYILNAEENLINSPDKATLVKIYKALGIISMKEHQHELALDYFNKSVFLAKKYNQNDELKNIYPMVSKAYEALKDYQKALHQHNNYKKINDSLNFETKKVINKIKNLPNKDYGRFDSFDYSIFGVCLLLITLMIVPKQDIVEASKSEIMVTTEKENQKQNILSYTSIEQLNQLTDLATKNEQAFYTKFQEIYPHFIINITEKFPKLSTADIRLCAYLKMNFDTKQIAVFTNSTIRSVDAKKYRLRKKLNLTPEEELYAYVSKF
ncbi:helix-turn-helix transcriptional regulator [Chryseobacterium arthrosphaerae]|uniref:helix-turn-helix transcriptional regulator n=3 Tax=Chryseobacterium arthrosphaerae TaxID=651561 RepID=UPI001F4A689C|nr:hypothetical protein [Chryseobacterium arthrosphaerae]